MLHLDYRDSRPIHQQVRDGLRRLMVTGVLQPGDQLPSVRKLATEGFVYSVAGRGSFVAEDGDQGRRRMAELTEGLHDTILELRQLGMTEQQWLDLWREEEEK